MMMRGQGYGGGRYNRMMRTPMEKPAKPADWKTIQRVIASFSPYKRQVAVVLAAIIVVGVLGIVNPLMLKYSIAIGFGEGRLDLLAIFVAVMIATPLVTGLIGVGQTYLNTQIGQKVVRDFRNRLYSHLQQMPLRFFTD